MNAKSGLVQMLAYMMLPSWRYHVFLSCREEYTRTNFTDHLYNALVGKEIKTFIERGLPRGEEISLTLLKAIEVSRISLVILSQNYADSRWCLEELVKIHQCKESKQQIILPVFYKVDLSDVRNQTGCYGDAFIGHERKFENKEKVLMWKRALTEVANLSRYHVKEKDYEATIISNIVKDILDRVPDLPKKSTYHLQIQEPFRDSQRVLWNSYDVLPPSPFALKSNNNNRYLRYMPDQENNFHQILQFSAQEPTSVFAQFQVERANSRDHQNNQYVHIKCLYNNKYLRRMDINRPLILAAADDPDENTHRWTCTLFKPESVGPTGNNYNNVPCRLRQVATGLYTKSFVANRLELGLGGEVPDPCEVDVYTALHTHT